MRQKLLADLTLPTFLLILLATLALPAAGETSAEETQVIRSFVLENLDLKDALTHVRSLLAVKNVSADETQNALTIRDTPAKLEVASRLLDLLDRPRGEVEIGVELLYLDLPASDLSLRPSTVELDELRRQGRVVTAQTIAVFDRDWGRFTLREDHLFTAHDGTFETLSAGLEIKVKPELRGANGELGLKADYAFRDGALSGEPAKSGPLSSSREATANVRLKAGQGLLLELGPVATRGPSFLSERFNLPPGGKGKLYLALSPRIVRESSARSAEL